MQVIRKMKTASMADSKRYEITLNYNRKRHGLSSAGYSVGDFGTQLFFLRYKVLFRSMSIRSDTPGFEAFTKFPSRFISIEYFRCLLTVIAN